MKLAKLYKRGQAGVSQLPGFFQIMMLVVIFAGLTFIVLDKFQTASYDKNTAGTNKLNESVVPTNLGTYLSVYTLPGASCTIIVIKNQSGAIGTVNAANYTLTGCLLNNATQLSTQIGPTWNVSYSYTYSANNTASQAIYSSTNDLYSYGIGFLGIIILVVMVYLIISIVSGRKSGAK